MKNFKKLLLAFCLMVGFGFEATSAIESAAALTCVGNTVDKASSAVFSLAAAIGIVVYSLNRKQAQEIINKKYCISVGQDGVGISSANFAQKAKRYLVKRFNKFFDRQEELSINFNLLDLIVLSSLFSVAIC